MKERYVIPQELRSKTLIISKISFFDICLLVVFFFFMMLFESYINSNLIIPYRIFNLIVGFILIQSSPINGNQPIYKSIYYLFISDKSVYHSISLEKGSLNVKENH